MGILKHIGEFYTHILVITFINKNFKIVGVAPNCFDDWLRKRAPYGPGLKIKFQIDFILENDTQGKHINKNVAR